jgi:hypothetical protein
MTEDTLFESVREIVHRHDPEGLLAVGAPRDEYDLEVPDLVLLVRQGDVITADSVRAVFDRWFGDSTPPARRRSEADQIAAELESIRRGLQQR